MVCTVLQEWNPESTRQQTWKVIRNWLTWCYTNNCFCPADKERALDYEHNVAPYISSPGAANGGLPENDRGVFRVLPDRLSRPTHVLVAARMSRFYGKDLYHFCHMGKEESVYAHALNSCMTHFRPDFRLLFDNCPIYDSGLHIRKLGLGYTFPGLVQQGQEGEAISECDPYVKAFAWRGAMGAQPLAEGLGVNIWGLLTMASLLESSDLHPKGSSDFARNVLGQILQHAPVSATPGNMVPIRSFNVHSGKPQYLVIPPLATRPEHFLRPVQDENFASSGELTYCREKHGLLPEDMMHCANLIGTASFLKCDYLNVAPAILKGCYQLMPKRRYPIVKMSSDGGSGDNGDTLRGDIYIENARARIRWLRDHAGSEEDCDFESVETDCSGWESALREHSLIVLPMVCRPCAAVWVEEVGGKVGLIVPAIDAPAGSSNCVNFDYDGWRYKVLHEEGGYLFRNPVKVLKDLVSVGTVLWLAPLSPAWMSLQVNMPGQIHPDERASYAIRVRVATPALTDPNKEKVYVSYLLRSKKGVGATTSKTIEVDPWELIPKESGGFNVVPVLLS